MAITREQKESVITKIKDAFDRSKTTVLVNYQGLNVAETQELRKMLAEAEVGYTIAKNSLVKLALAKLDAFKATDTQILSGPVALAFGYDDEVAPAQTLAKFAKSHPALQMVGGLTAEGTILTAEQVTELSQLPSKDQLRGQLVGTIAAPLTGVINTMAGNLRGLINVLNGAATKS